MIKSNLLKAELLKHNCSIDDVAQWLGKSKPTVYRKISGRASMYLDEASIICENLGLTLEMRGQIFLGR